MGDTLRIADSDGVDRPGRVLGALGICVAAAQLAAGAAAVRGGIVGRAVFVLNTKCNMAGEWVVGGVEAKCFAYAFVLLALAELVVANWNLVWLLLGVATAFHPLVGGWSGVVCVAIWVLYGRREQPQLLMLPGLWAGGMIALVGIVPALC